MNSGGYNSVHNRVKQAKKKKKAVGELVLQAGDVQKCKRPIENCLPILFSPCFYIFLAFDEFFHEYHPD